MNNPSIAFDRAADFYDETRGFPPGVEKQAAALMAQVGRLNPTSRVLEIGIGTGRIALPLAAHVRTVAGIDLARPMMERLVSKRTEEPVHVVEGSAEHLPFPDQSWDGSVAVHVFHLIPGWRTVLNELARVLKPEASLIHAWGHASEDDLWSIWEKTYGQPAVGVARTEQMNFLPEAGWRRVGEKQTLAYKRTIVPRTLIERIEKRVFSATWRMTDEQIAAGAAFMKSLIQERYGNPDQSVEIELYFSAEAFLPPEN